jgi:sigma-B regulation protein RsbU (phosphoserine phosphatase)
LQRSFVELLTPGGRLYHETHFAPMLRLQGSVREIALDVLRADRTRMPVLVNATLERDATGRPSVVRIALFDATERREYERELLRAKRRAEESEQRSRELAQTLQQTLLPPRQPAIPGLEVAAAFRAAGEGAELGGDFYDVFQIAEGDWVAVIGDICGKGVEAAVLTALVRHTLRAVVVGLHAPSQALQALNEVLLQHDTRRFCTVAMLRLQRADGSWQVTAGTGGHPRPLVVRPGAVAAEVGGSGPLVGVREQPVFVDEQLVLAPGDAVVLYTDGVTESRSVGEFYGDERLRGVVSGGAGSAQALVDAVLQDVLAFSAGPPRDDIAVLALRVPPS